MPDGFAALCRELNCEILSHPAAAKADILGTRGFSLPKWSIPEVHTQPSDSLAERGISFVGSVPENCKLVIDTGLQRCNLKVDFAGKLGSSVYLGPGCGIDGGVRLNGDNNIFVASGFFAQGGPSRISVTLGATNSAIVFCKDVSSVGSTWIIEGDQSSAIVGDDCMISWQVQVRNYDSHCIFDLDTEELINGPTDLAIGNHCWIGQGVDIIKGVRIGAGSIIGARSLVTSDIPAQCAVGGVPAKTIRTRVGWDRARRAGKDRIREIDLATKP